MLNTEERMEVAKNVIELCAVTDEDLKQEIYASALEFRKVNPDGLYDKCKECGKVKCIQCLSDYLMDITRTYNEQCAEKEAHENLESVILDHFDHLILTALMLGRY